MQYEDALKQWGKIRLEDHHRYGRGRKHPIQVNTVTVEMDFDEGYQCSCGGSDPDCYCSFAESPSANVVITGLEEATGKRYEMTIGHYEWDFATILKEIIEAGDGSVTST